MLSLQLPDYMSCMQHNLTRSLPQQEWGLYQESVTRTPGRLLIKRREAVPCLRCSDKLASILADKGSSEYDC